MNDKAKANRTFTIKSSKDNNKAGEQVVWIRRSIALGNYVRSKSSIILCVKVKSASIA